MFKKIFKLKKDLTIEQACGIGQGRAMALKQIMYDKALGPNAPWQTISDIILGLNNKKGMTQKEKIFLAFHVGAYLGRKEALVAKMIDE